MRFLMLFFVATLFVVERASATEKLTVAVAANFREPMQAILKNFEARTQHQTVMTVSSSGKLYAQIRQGAPFDIFFSADTEKPRQLEKLKRMVEGSRFVYARGSLVLFSTKKEIAETFTSGVDTLSDNSIKRIAIANPRFAPYGRAAKEVMQNLGVYDRLKSRLVFGENINHAMNFAVAGGVDLGLLALSQVINQPEARYWRIPEKYHQPIAQEAVVLKSGQVVDALVEYFHSSEVSTLIRSYGYSVDINGMDLIQ